MVPSRSWFSGTGGSGDNWFQRVVKEESRGILWP